MMNTQGIIDTARISQRIKTKQPYVNSWFEAPAECWERILSDYATPLAKLDSSKRAPNKSTVARMVVLYGHLLASAVARRSNQKISISTKWLWSNFGLRINRLTSEGTGIELVRKSFKDLKSGRGYCSAVYPVTEVLELLSLGGEIQSVREFLSSKGVNTQSLKYSGIKSCSIQELIESEEWSSSVPDDYSIPVSSVVSLSSGSGHQELLLPKYNPVIINTTISERTYPKVLIRVDLDAAYRQLGTYPTEQQALYRSPLDFIRKHSSVEGFYQSRYKPFSFHGRYYEYGGGLQNLKTDLRQALLSEELDAKRIFNYDIEKCQAMGMVQIFQHLKLNSQLLEDILGHFQTVCDDLGVTKGLMKTALYAGVWNGSLNEFRGHCKLPIHTDVAEAFINEMGENEGLNTLKKVREYLKPISSEIKKASKKMGVPLGAVLTELEQSYIHTIVVLCEQSDVSVLSLQHDGIITSKEIPSKLMQAAAELSGFNQARLIQKPFTEVPDFRPEAAWEILEPLFA